MGREREPQINNLCFGQPQQYKDQPSSVITRYTSSPTLFSSRAAMAAQVNSIIAGMVMAMVVIVMVIARVVNRVWQRPKRLERCLRRQNLNGNSYRLVFGDLKEMGRMIEQAKSKPISIDDDIVPRIIPFHHQLFQNYGMNSFMWFGPYPMVTIANPEDIKEVFNNISVFEKPPNNPLGKLLITGILDYNGEKWSKHRRIVNPAFHLEKLKLMLPAFYESCNEMVKKWVRLVSESQRDYCEIDVWPFFQSMTGDAISRTAFGSSYEEGQKIFQLQSEQAILTIKVLQSVYIPGWRFVPTKLNRRLKEIEKEIQALVRGIIQKREKAREAGEAPSDDLLGILLESNCKEIKDKGNKNNVGMSIEDVIKECKLFYLAGQETTSVLLNWMIVLLCKYPNWQSQAREEVFQVFSTQTPDYDGLNRLKLGCVKGYKAWKYEFTSWSSSWDSSNSSATRSSVVGERCKGVQSTKIL
ncbi:cytochrome P450 CYP72A219-like isoform X2 [Prosopis cineraria]|uniref:cytochrome P450 CYP72A219-like isoform X2 n=1 Tax=Prosopis cineraria TaxID=364024 RepID=UPI00241082B7|nr:cytochrome P450 CYP72A219-like isoform X2 [Prosopis cineraria]